VALSTSSGTPVRVTEMIGRGGQGEIFAVQGPDSLVLKQYFAAELAKNRTLERRLQAMIANKPADRVDARQHVVLAWPSDIVMRDGRFAGFLMPAVNTKNTVGIHRVTNPDDRRKGSPTDATGWTRDFTWRYLVRIGLNLAQVTGSLHAADTVIGDFNDSNVRVTRDARVTMLDCDSMQITDPDSGERFLCSVGRPEFTPPELIGVVLESTIRRPSSDLFALAVHLYALLLEGEHPFRGAWRGPGDKPPAAELARLGSWAWQPGGALRPRRAAIDISLLPGNVIELFRRAFEDGARDAEARPTAYEWYRALSEVESGLRECPADASHVYPDLHGQACPWCCHEQTRSLQVPIFSQPPVQAAGVPYRYYPASGSPAHQGRPVSNPAYGGPGRRGTAHGHGVPPLAPAPVNYPPRGRVRAPVVIAAGLILAAVLLVVRALPDSSSNAPSGAGSQSGSQVPTSARGTLTIIPDHDYILAVGAPYPIARVGGADVGHLTGTTDGVEVYDAYALPLAQDVAGSYESCLSLDWVGPDVWQVSHVIPWSQLAPGQQICVQTTWGGLWISLLTVSAAPADNEVTFNVTTWPCNARPDESAIC
jgi:hypothetical protein